MPPTLPLIPDPRRTVYRYAFWAATLYNVLWGVPTIVAPSVGLSLLGIQTDAVGLQFWQCIGMFVMVFAIGYAYAAHDPERYAPFILIATLGKIFGPVGFVYGAATGKLPWSVGWTIIPNDLVWWPIFFPFCWETIVAPWLRGRSAGDVRDAGPTVPDAAAGSPRSMAAGGR